MYVVVEMMLGMLMGITGPFKSKLAAQGYAIRENSKLKQSDNTQYVMWPLKEKSNAAPTLRKKARSKRTS